MGLRTIELFAGAGGGVYAHGLLGHRVVCYVERDDYCQRVIRQRIADGIFDDAPIWDDVRTFDCRPWRGKVDCVSGGFPCQPFSTASRGRKAAVDLWPHMLRIVRECMPRHVFVENVQRDPVKCAAAALKRLGYHGRPFKLCPTAMGAAAKRPRWWLLADRNHQAKPGFGLNAKVASLSTLARVDAWADPGGVLGVAYGVANRSNRLGAIGNGQVPLVAATAWRLLAGTDR
jgi:DNA (cytosine-5)-methyltransferase 1